MNRPEHGESRGGRAGRNAPAGDPTAREPSTGAAGGDPSAGAAGGGGVEQAGSGAWSVVGIGLLLILFVVAAVATVHSLFVTLVG